MPTYKQDQLYIKDGKLYARSGVNSGEFGDQYFSTKNDPVVSNSDKISVQRSVIDGDSITYNMPVSSFKTYADTLPKQYDEFGDNLMNYYTQQDKDFFSSGVTGYSPSVYGSTYADDPNFSNYKYNKDYTNLLAGLGNDSNIKGSLEGLLPYVQGNSITGISPVAGSNNVLWNLTTDTGNEYILTTSGKSDKGGGWNVNTRGLDPDFETLNGNAMFGAIAPKSQVEQMPTITYYKQDSSWLDTLGPALVLAAATWGAGGLAGLMGGGTAAAGSTTAAGMLAAESASMLQMGFSAAEVASSLAGLGNAAQIGSILTAAGIPASTAASLAADAASWLQRVQRLPGLAA
jgi:hypothetical protein